MLIHGIENSQIFRSRAENVENITELPGSSLMVPEGALPMDPIRGPYTPVEATAFSPLPKCFAAPENHQGIAPYRNFWFRIGHYKWEPLTALGLPCATGRPKLKKKKRCKGTFSLICACILFFDSFIVITCYRHKGVCPTHSVKGGYELKKVGNLL